VLYSRYRPEKMMEHIKVFWSRMNTSKMLRACEAGRHWPDPLPPRLDLVWSLVVLPPLVLGVWLLVGWRLPDTDDVADDGGESLRGTESVPKEPPFPQER
jgi:hypothetical protein